ncbi:hypothetical protein JCM10207_002754 [Rhodosporidiobolus poonsookiae]
MQAARTQAHCALRTLTRSARPCPPPRTASHSLPSTSSLRSFSTYAPRSAPVDPSSSSPSSPPPPSPHRPSSAPGTHLFSPSPSAQLSFLSALLAPVQQLLPNPALLDEHLAAKALTHKSGVDKRALYGRKEAMVQGDQPARTGHNEKLAFIGRRALRLHLTTHLLRTLSSRPALLSTALSPASLDTLLETKTLGASVGRAWGLEGALRWREVRDSQGERSGLWKCRGGAVEAVVGAAYTTQGLAASTAVFEQLILPSLSLPATLAGALSPSGAAPQQQSQVVDDVPRPSVQEQVQA